eukprot:6953087-Prymnesium_polylepis.1
MRAPFLYGMRALANGLLNGALPSMTELRLDADQWKYPQEGKDILLSACAVREIDTGSAWNSLGAPERDSDSDSKLTAVSVVVRWTRRCSAPGASAASREQRERLDTQTTYEVSLYALVRNTNSRDGSILFAALCAARYPLSTRPGTEAVRHRPLPYGASAEREARLYPFRLALDPAASSMTRRALSNGRQRHTSASNISTSNSTSSTQTSGGQLLLLLSYVFVGLRLCRAERD